MNSLTNEVLADAEKSIKLESKDVTLSFRLYEMYEIGDLLDLTQRNLEDDSKNVLSLENLTEEYVTSYDDVTQFVTKGISSRKFGVTTLNSKSSRSRIISNIVIESWCKVLLGGGAAEEVICGCDTSKASVEYLAHAWRL
ncbi:unnamed protein product [Vicia faba]|uniref:Kinesin motor domain-containing protein n=1 Tax=Vicia faba TaxID=3906 RepID=A0AAV1B7A6_VICFA|nr:unnamed protein product [Vicia faba]